MAVSTAVGSFESGTGIVGTTIPIAGLGFTPKFIKFFWNGQTGVGNLGQQQTHVRGTGIAVSPTSRRAISSYSLDGVATSDTSVAQTMDQPVLTQLPTDGSLDGRLDLDSLDVGGFTMIVDAVFTNSIRINFWAVGGADILDAEIATVITPVPGVTDHTPFTFMPNYVYFISAHESNDDQERNDGRFMIGAAASPTKQAVVSTQADDGAGTTDTSHYSLDGVECIARAKRNGDIDARAEFLAFIANGFRLDWLEVGGGEQNEDVFVLGVRGGAWSVDSFVTPLDTITDIVVTGLAAQPEGGMMFSARSAENAQDVEGASDFTVMGAWDDGLVDQHSMAAHDTDARATSQVAVYKAFNRVFVDTRSGNPNNTNAEMSVKSIQATGYTSRMDKAGSSVRFIWAVSVGPLVPPADPTALGVTCVAFDQIDLAWTDNAVDEDNYRIERETPIGGGFSEIDLIAANSVAYSDTTVLPSTQYNYRVRACKTGPLCSGSSNEDACTTPAAPTGGGELTRVEGPTSPLTTVVG